MIELEFTDCRSVHCLGVGPVAIVPGYKKNNDHKVRQEQNINFDMRDARECWGAFRIWIIHWRRILLGYVLSFEATVIIWWMTK